MKGSLEKWQKKYLKAYEIGVYNYYGGDESSMTADNCEILGDCALLMITLQGESLSTLMYFTQLEYA